MTRLRPRMTPGRPGNGNGDGGVKADTTSALADKLVRLGMPEDEATLYVRLQNSGPRKAAEISSLLGVTRQKVYRTLDAMALHGYATGGTGRPRVFSAVKPATLLQLLHSRLEALESEFDDALTTTLPSLDALRGLRAESPDDVHFTVLRGVEAVAEQARHMCQSTEAEVRLILGAPPDKPLVKSLAGTKAVEEMDARLLVARSVVQPPPIVPPQKLRVADRETLATAVIVDEVECLVVVSPQDGKRGAEPALAYRTNAPGVVALQHTAFEAFWRDATAPKNGSGR